MITANIATLPSRKKQLVNTIISLLPQVDKINLFLNGHKKKPFKHEKVNVVFSDNSLGDIGKFMFLENYKGYYFTCDDDLIYPSTYIFDTIQKIKKYKTVVSYHGRKFLKFPIENYYHTPAIRNQCLSAYGYDEPLDVCGTGVMAFHTDHFRIPIDFFKEKNMTDIWVGCYAKKIGIPLIGLAHDENYFKYQQVQNTIWEEKNNNCKFETEIINKYFAKKKEK